MADRSLRHVRDEAIIRLMAEIGIRLSEVIALTALTALDVRHEQRHADRPELRLGARRCGLAADALYRSLRRRAEGAGITGFRPHRLRHTAAHRWFAAGHPSLA